MTPPDRLVGSDAARAFFHTLLAGEDAPRLDLLMLAIAGEEVPEVDVKAALEALDTLAAGLDACFPRNASPLVQLGVLSRYLFQTSGFRGDEANYYDPRHSVLPDVLTRRRGIPITLSVVTIEVARRVGMELEGVGFPGHFLVASPELPSMFLDPFRGGQILRREDCRELLAKLSGGNLTLKDSHVERVSTLQLAARVLQNIKGNHLRQSDLSGAVRAVDRILILFPEAHGLRRERGLLYLQMGAYAAAVCELAAYLDLAVDPPDVASIRPLLEDARRKEALLN